MAVSFFDYQYHPLLQISNILYVGHADGRGPCWKPLKIKELGLQCWVMGTNNERVKEIRSGYWSPLNLHHNPDQADFNSLITIKLPNCPFLSCNTCSDIIYFIQSCCYFYKKNHGLKKYNPPCL